MHVILAVSENDIFPKGLLRLHDVVCQISLPCFLFFAGCSIGTACFSSCQRCTDLPTGGGRVAVILVLLSFSVAGCTPSLFAEWSTANETALVSTCGL